MLKGLLTILLFILSLINSSPLQKSDKVIVGYYADWTSSKLSPEAIPYQKLTHLNYAFATLSDSFAIQLSTTDLLQTVAHSAKGKGVKVLLSVGGWSGSGKFSPMAATASTRQVFIESCLSFVDKYQLDGIDIDWEFPGRTGMSCNVVDLLNDTPNFLQLLNELRQALDNTYKGNDKKLITLATRISPFEVSGAPYSDIAAFAKYVDFINIMAYDINGAWSATTGPNAPFEGDLSFTGSSQAWIKAGFPKEQIVMGLPMYGRAVTTTSAYSTGSPLGLPISKEIPKGDADDAKWAEPCPGSPATYSGVWTWKNLRTSALVAEDGQTGSGAIGGWDTQSQTPWIYLPVSKSFISYDDPRSLKLKVDYCNENNLAGVMLWDLHQDNGELLDSIHNSL